MLFGRKYAILNDIVRKRPKKLIWYVSVVLVVKMPLRLSSVSQVFRFLALCIKLAVPYSLLSKDKTVCVIASIHICHVSYLLYLFCFVYFILFCLILLVSFRPTFRCFYVIMYAMLSCSCAYFTLNFLKCVLLPAALL